MTLGEKLRKIRMTEGLSMSELSDVFWNNYDIRIAKSMVSRWERDLAEPTIIYLTAYAQYFHLDMNWLLGITTDERHISPILLTAQNKLSKEDLLAVEHMAQFYLDRINRKIPHRVRAR